MRDSRERLIAASSITLGVAQTELVHVGGEAFLVAEYACSQKPGPRPRNGELIRAGNLDGRGQLTINRGRGLSGDNRDHSPPRLQEDVTGFVNGIGEPVGLVGWSGSGAWVLGAAAHSDCVAAVAIYEPGVIGVGGEHDVARLGAAMQQVGAAAADGRIIDAVRAFLPGICTDHEIAALRRHPSMSNGRAPSPHCSSSSSKTCPTRGLRTASPRAWTPPRLRQWRSALRQASRRRPRSSGSRPARTARSSPGARSSPPPHALTSSTPTRTSITALGMPLPQVQRPRPRASVVLPAGGRQGCCVPWTTWSDRSALIGMTRGSRLRTLLSTFERRA